MGLLVAVIALFVIIYFAVVSSITPPVALASFAAAGMAQADPWKTSWIALKMGLATFLVPFMFVLDPSGLGLLLMGSTKALAAADWWAIGEVAFTAAIGIAALAAGFQGWAFRRTTFVERWMFLAAGFALVYPGWIADVAGFGLVTAALALQWLRRAEENPKRA